MSNGSGWSTEEHFRFIELYQNQPEIWNTKHVNHKDKVKVSMAWDRIADEMQVPVTELKKKKDSLLAAYRFNHKKVVASLQWAACEEDVFKPIWVYYDALASFMDNIYECKFTHGNRPRAIQEDKLDIKEEEIEYTEAQSPQEQDSDTTDYTPVQKRSRRRTIPIEYTENSNITSTAPISLAETNQNLNSTPSNNLTEMNEQLNSTLSNLNSALKAIKYRDVNVDEDDCDLYGRLVAKAMREFSDMDRLELRHEIDGLILKKKRALADPIG